MLDNGYEAVGSDGCTDLYPDSVLSSTQNFLILRCCLSHLKSLCKALHNFFKWIKQHLHIKTFYGTTQNAVYTQIWIAVCDYLLLVIAKKRYGLVPSLHSISNSIGQVLFKRADIRELYNQPTATVSVLEKGAGEQLTLW